MPSLASDVALLRRAPLFAEASDDSLRMLAFSCRREQFAPDETLLDPDIIPHGALIVDRGAVLIDDEGDVRRRACDDNPLIVAELACLAASRLKTRIVAETPCEGLRVTRPHALRLFAEDPQLARRAEERLERNLKATLAAMSRVAAPTNV